MRTRKTAAMAMVIAGALGLSGCVVVVPPSGGASAGPATATAAPTGMGGALNAARAANGLPAVVPNAALMAAAQEQASFMARTQSLTHSGAGGSTVGQRARRAGCAYSWVGENVAWGQSSDAETMEGWMQSSGHRSNNLNRNATSYGSAEVGGYRALVLAGGC